PSTSRRVSSCALRWRRTREPAYARNGDQRPARVVCPGGPGGDGRTAGLTWPASGRRVPRDPAPDGRRPLWPPESSRRRRTPRAPVREYGGGPGGTDPPAGAPPPKATAH